MTPDNALIETELIDPDDRVPLDEPSGTTALTWIFHTAAMLVVPVLTPSITR